MALLLYGTEGCHLCDEAELLIRSVLTPETELLLIDIVDDDELYEKYQFTIPVLSNDQIATTINWPFDETDILELLVQ